MRFLPAAAFSVLAFAGPASAEEGVGGVYKCTAENGAVTYSSSPCKGAKREFLSKEKLEGKLSVIEFPKAEAATPGPSTPEPSTPEPSTPEPSAPEPSTASRKAPAGSAAAVTAAPAAAPVANPKMRTSPIERKLRKD